MHTHSKPLQKKDSKNDLIGNQASKVTKTPTHINKVLSLQKTIGNRAVQEMLARKGDCKAQSAKSKEQSAIRLSPRALLLSPSVPVQAKLKVGAPNDIYEQEADRVAAQVMRMPADSILHMANSEEHGAKGRTPSVLRLSPCVEVQRMCPECEEEMQRLPIGKNHQALQRQPGEEEKDNLQMQPLEEEEEVQRQPIEENENELHRQPEEEEKDKLQMQTLDNEEELKRQLEEDEEEIVQTKNDSTKTPKVTSDIESQIQSKKGGGQPLSGSAQEFFGERMGSDFSGVRIHTDTGADKLNRELNAKAFTTGQDIFFRQGEYNPESSKGKELVGHELTHVVQQGSVNNKVLTLGTQPDTIQPTTNVQRALPSHVGMFSLDLMADDYNAMVKRVNDEVGLKARRVGELAELLKGFTITAEIDTEIMQETAGKIREVSAHPGEQPIEKATEEYLTVYEELEKAPTPDAEQFALGAAIDGLNGAITDATTVEQKDVAEKDEKQLAAEKVKIKNIASAVGTGVETSLKVIKAAITGKGWVDIGISVAKLGATKITQWLLSNRDSFKQMEEKLKNSKKRVKELKNLSAAYKVQKAQKTLYSAQAELERKLHEIGNKISKVERAEKNLTIEMRALGLEGAAGAIETRAASRQTSSEMLFALTEYETAIQGVMPDAIKVYNNFDSLEISLNDPGPPLVENATQRMEVRSLCSRAKRPKLLLEGQLKIIQQNRQLVESGHFENLYAPVHKILHETQA